MLENNDYNETTFEEFFSDALSQIPLYTGEWTNFNASDPGITILENLTAFNVLQQTYINRMTDSIQYGLLALAGIKRQPGKSAKVLLSLNGQVEEQIKFEKDRKFMVGDLCFENDEEIVLDNQRITDVFLKAKGKITSMEQILYSDIPVKSGIWGDKPKEGNAVYFIINKLSDEDKKIHMYVVTGASYPRNPIEWEEENPFAKVKWQLYTEKGYVDLKVEDNSECFLRDGQITLYMPKEKPAVYTHHGYNGYAVRAVLEKAEYDIPPKVNYISAFIFEVWQRDTKVLCLSYNDSIRIPVCADMSEKGYVRVYGRDEGEEDFYKYTKSDGVRSAGRFYEVRRLGYGRYRLRFSKKKYGYAPKEVKVVIYNEEMMKQYHLGMVQGYDNQEIKLPIKDIIPETFSVIAEYTDSKGIKKYNFVKPDEKGTDALVYELDESEGVMLIKSAGSFVNAELYLGSLAVTHGTKGNIDAGKKFTTEGYKEISFINISPGKGGKKKDSLQELKEQFAKKVNSQEVAVTAYDYERIVKNTPGLCINKVKAVADVDTNTVDIVVVPSDGAKFPRLSDTYRKIILGHINRYRPMLTRVNIVKPEYVAVDVNLNVRVKPHYMECESMIDEVIREQTDYINAEHGFGEVLQYERLYHAVSSLDCVAEIIELEISARNNALAKKQELNIKPEERCLLYPGNINITTELRRI
jgi:hypothetical protein